MSRALDLSVLIVDDNQYACALAAAQLKSLGVANIKQVASGAEALLSLQSETHDVLLMDWYMPDVSGAGILSVVRDNRFIGDNNIPVVVMTAYASAENIERALALGANEIVVKPVEAEALGKAMLKALSTATQNSKNAANDQYVEDADDGDDDDAVALL